MASDGTAPPRTPEQSSPWPCLPAWWQRRGQTRPIADCKDRTAPPATEARSVCSRCSLARPRFLSSPQKTAAAEREERSVNGPLLKHLPGRVRRVRTSIYLFVHVPRARDSFSRSRAPSQLPNPSFPSLPFPAAPDDDDDAAAELNIMGNSDPHAAPQVNLLPSETAAAGAETTGEIFCGLPSVPFRPGTPRKP